jgi:hypothetical protein
MAREETKYGHLISGDEFNEDDIEDDEITEQSSPVDLQHQTVKVLWTAGERDLEYRAVISHGDHEWEPICTHVQRAHRLADSNQFDPMSAVDWTDLPRMVQERVLDVVAGVERIDDLDPEHALGVTLNGDYDE